MEPFAPAIINIERQVALLVGELPFTPLVFTLSGETVVFTDSARHQQTYRIGEKTRQALDGARNLKLFETDADGSPVKFHCLTRKAKGPPHG